ncbi:hypothetical protein HUW51_06975 [Adhaeribacter swui]|uniref:Uncharacterized protein n=1 Tax=Adhaeribacter swui TaxID=2086471 RepID=A0A7G7G5P9_9BACT|nr:hypothetical protein [Adhaeribacter swui]QNF32483.1 hypothetical protein HUW51_06975 [Adhaeribacter swui]
MAKVYCLKIPGSTKILTLRNVRPVKPAAHTVTSCPDSILLDLAGNCFTNKPQASIIIGGYVIQSLDSEGSVDLQIKY